MSFTRIYPPDLPYLTHLPTDGRGLPMMTLLDAEGVWHAYLGQPDGSLLIVHPVDVASTFLSNSSPATIFDVDIPLSNVIVQHFSFPDTIRLLENIEHDFLNSLASLHKYFVLLAYAKATPAFLPNVLVSTELEFAFANHRSFYDLLNRLFIPFTSGLSSRTSTDGTFARPRFPIRSTGFSRRAMMNWQQSFTSRQLSSHFSGVKRMSSIGYARSGIVSCIMGIPWDPCSHCQTGSPCRFGTQSGASSEPPASGQTHS